MHQSRAQTVACGLGFFSIALGATQILFPRLIAHASGASVPPAVVRLCGMREIVNGVVS
jgi:branched-subunit amino acid permease